LKEALGDDCYITDVDYPKARKVKEMLIHTPVNRNKVDGSRGLTLDKQIKAQAKLKLTAISSSTVNKYLSCISALFRWALKNKYIAENPFQGMRVEVDKKQIKRLNFTDGEVRIILDGISRINTDKALGKTRYWGSLLYIYTGARLNEIASLTPDDILKDDKSDIWYLSINEDGENKSIKTKAGKRLVPIHPRLIELGFLNYVDHAREVISKRPLTNNGEQMRLLYNLTYREGTWGKKLGRWFNDTFLPNLELKTKLHVLHSLRHSFITNLNDAGVSPVEIATLAGHEHKTVTFGVYAKFSISHLPISYEAIKKLSYE